MRRLTFAAVLLLAVGPLVAARAWADGPLTTTSSAQIGAPQPSTPAPPLPPAPLAMRDGQPVAMGPCGPEKVKPDGKLDTAPHGEVYGGVGNHGYREVGGSICQPIGQNAAVSISIDDSQGNYGYRR